MGRLSATKIVLESLIGSGGDIIAHIIEIWGQFRVPVLVPLLTLLLYVSLAMSIMLFVEKVYMSSVVGFNYLFGRKTEKCYKWEEFKNDVESGNSVYPLVLIQVPMFNEREVYQLSIGAACGLSWPSDRIVIQVLDDSTDPVIKDMVEVECHKWAGKGTNIHYQVRDNRKGYKAGALKEGLKHGYANECEYVVIFDADFQPESDFLRKTIPFLHHNSEIGLVQARWKFANSDECLMTRMQEMSLNYHFKVEQEFGSSTHAFFGFNGNQNCILGCELLYFCVNFYIFVGTAGVWRMAAINEAGGWKDRTTVEDMDLAVRASLKGWKFLYLGSLKVKNELPSVFKAYRFQQHRWSCGPANLFRKMIYEIMMNKKVALWKKLHVIYSFFFVRKIVAHIGTFVLYCVVIPASVWIPEVEVPVWATVYIPTVITILNAVATPRSFYLVVFWVVFENVMALHRTKATFIGLFETQRVNEWVVTEKHGDASKAKSAITHQQRLGLKLSDRLLVLEFCMGIILFISGCYDLAYGKYYYYIYLYLQAIAFVVTGLGYVGTHIPNS